MDKAIEKGESEAPYVGDNDATLHHQCIEQ